MKRALLGILVVLSLLMPTLFASASPAGHKVAVHHTIGVVKNIWNHRITLETIVNGDKERIDILYGKYPIGVKIGERVRASYELMGMERIALEVKPLA